jgi:excisionase family DNA binding protein
MEPLLVRPSDAAKALAMSRTSLYALLAAGEIDSIKCGASRLIPVEGLRAWIERQRGRASSENPLPETEPSALAKR